MSIQIVWFKKDLRIYDHAPLFCAAQNGVVLPLFIFEPEFWSLPDNSPRHYNFLMQSLNDLQDQLNSIGLRLTIKVGSALDVFADLYAEFKSITIWSHEETGNMWTFERDKLISKFVLHYQIDWFEHARNGVVRRLNSRENWSAIWYQRMTQPSFPVPNNPKGAYSKNDQIIQPSWQGKASSVSKCDISAGRKNALKMLHSFLYSRGYNYSKKISSPLTAAKTCSRLSTYITFGTLSVRDIYTAANQAYHYYQASEKVGRSVWLRSIKSFLSRLHWHCHFIQKLEDQPAIEFEPLHPLVTNFNKQENMLYLDAWKEGKTGYPFVDACMRQLIATGWINFRMRAMLMSFASYHLNINWRQSALYLAQLFVDYEPGIHYSQCQMQSGLTGINSIRIYNPIKQGIDHDPTGKYIRKWVPELEAVTNSIIHMPWHYSYLPLNYPKPIVDEVGARKLAQQRIKECRKQTGFRFYSQQIFEKHGSRKKRVVRKNKSGSIIQLSLFE